MATKKPRGIFERPPGSGVWWIHYHDAEGRRRRERVGAKSVAVKLYQKRKTEVREGRLFPEQRRRAPLLSALVRSMLARRTRVSADYRRYEALWLESLGDRPIDRITTAEIEAHVARRRKALKASSVNRELTFIRAAFNLAIRDELVRKSPVLPSLFAEEDTFKRTRWLSLDEEARLRAHMPADAWPLVVAGMNTGIRRARLFGLRWEQVDLTTGHITVPAAKQGKTYRVPINDTMRELLTNLPSRLKSPWVFPSTGRGPVDAARFVREVFKPALRKARVRDFTWHDLRHTFGTRLALAGATLREIQGLLGHLSPAMTERYAHLVDEYQRAAVRRLDASATATETATGRVVVLSGRNGHSQVRGISDESSEPCADRTHDPLLKRRIGASRRKP